MLLITAGRMTSVNAMVASTDAQRMEIVAWVEDSFTAKRTYEIAKVKAEITPWEGAKPEAEIRLK